MSASLTIAARSSVGARALVLSAIVAVVVSGFPIPAAGEEPVSGPLVRATILRGIDAIRKRQEPGAGWPDYAQEGGVTALASYALLQAGVSPDEKDMAAAIEKVRRTTNQNTYVVSLKILALVSADPKKHKSDIASAAAWLAETQDGTGGWGYGKVLPLAETVKTPADLKIARSEAQMARALARPDASNTQFAVLALSEAARAGAAVPIDVWRKADRFFRISQLPNGGWGYVYHDPDPDEAYGSMTAAAVASLCLTADHLAGQEPAETAADRQAAIERGIDWMRQYYTLKENPRRELAWYYFWLYSLERVGVISGRRTFGDHDWFCEGMTLLVSGQRPDGSWTDRTYHDSLCLLFLTKGYRPLLVQRLQWEGQWRRDPRDLDHLVRFLGSRVGGGPVAWQTLSVEAPTADYLAAPVLHVAGRGPLRMLGAGLAHLKAYVQQGGVVVFDAEGGDAAFLDSARDLVTSLFPESKFEPLPADHPIYRSVHRLPLADLEAMNVGCRAAVILAPKGLATAWAAADPDRPNDALRLGENLAAYAAGLDPLPDRLAAATVLAMPAETTVPRGASRVGQVLHDGDWNPRPYAVPSLLKELAERFGVAIFNRPSPVRLTDPNLGQYHVLYMTGHYAFHFSADEKAALKAFLDRGGYLVAEACCGRPAFDKALRGLAAELFPDSALEELPADHPIFSGKVGAPIANVAYAPAVRAESPNLAKPVLLGVKRGGRLAILYSPYGLAPGLDGIRTWGARTYVPEDARRVAANVFLYALTY